MPNSISFPDFRDNLINEIKTCYSQGFKKSSYLLNLELHENSRFCNEQAYSFIGKTIDDYVNRLVGNIGKYQPSNSTNPKLNFLFLNILNLNLLNTFPSLDLSLLNNLQFENSIQELFPHFSHSINKSINNELKNFFLENFAKRSENSIFENFFIHHIFNHLSSSLSFQDSEKIKVLEFMEYNFTNLQKHRHVEMPSYFNWMLTIPKHLRELFSDKDFKIFPQATNIYKILKQISLYPVFAQNIKEQIDHLDNHYVEITPIVYESLSIEPIFKLQYEQVNNSIVVTFDQNDAEYFHTAISENIRNVLTGWTLRDVQSENNSLNLDIDVTMDDPICNCIFSYGDNNLPISQEQVEKIFNFIQEHSNATIDNAHNILHQFALTQSLKEENTAKISKPLRKI